MQEIGRKRPLPVAPDETVPTGDSKRIKTVHPAHDIIVPTPLAPKPHRPVVPAILANFDFASLPVSVLADVVIDSLKLVTDEDLNAAIEVRLLL